MRDPRFAIARREFSSLSREKTIVLALLIQLFVAAFSSFLVVGLTSLYDPSTVGSGAEVDAALTGNATDDLLEAAREVDGLSVGRYASRTDAMADFQRGRVDAVLVAEPRGSRISVEATAPRGSLRTTLVVVQLRAALESLERQQRAERANSLDERVVPLPPATSGSPYFGFSYTILLPLLLFMPVFISGSVAVDTVTEEIERGTLELLCVTPTTLVAVLDGKALTTTLLAPAQALLWIGLLTLNGISIANVGVLVLYVTALSALLVTFGIGVGVATADRRHAQLTYSFGIILLFGASALLPEPPATTVAKLAIESATLGSFVTVLGTAVVAVLAATVVRRFAASRDLDRL